MTQRRVLLLVVLVGIVIVVGIGIVMFDRLSNPETVTLTSVSRDIAFVSNRDNGQWGIYLLTPDGTIERLSPAADGATGPCTDENQGQAGCAFDYFPSYSFDGNMINFLTNRQGDEMGPAQVRPDGTDFRTLDIAGAIASVALDQRFDWDPMWSSDGWLAWAKIANLNLELFVRPPETDAQEIRLTRDGINGARDWFPAWSPDGETLLYNSDQAGNEDIYRVNRDEINADIAPGDMPITRLTDNPVDDLHPTWSLDGEQVLFISDLDDGLLYGDLQLFVMNPDGSDQRPLDGAFEGDPIYSADGAQMVYMSNADGTWSLYLKDVGSGDVQQLTDDTGDDLFPVWGPVPDEQATDEVDE